VPCFTVFTGIYLFYYDFLKIIRLATGFKEQGVVKTMENTGKYRQLSVKMVKTPNYESEERAE
jgi:hypothetical protein